MSRRPADPAWVRAAAWLAVFAPLPYSLSRLAWAAGIPLGIDEWLLREFQSPGWGSLYILCLALLPEAVAAFTQVFIRDGARALPAKIPLLGGRPVAPGMVVSVLLVPIVVLAGFNIWSLDVMANGFSIPAENEGVAAWSFWGQVVTFWVWGVALALVTYRHWRRSDDSARCGAGTGRPGPSPARPSPRFGSRW